jgi:hypothetical protein
MKKIIAVLIIYGGILLAHLAFWGAIIYIAYHFISKYW